MSLQSQINWLVRQVECLKNRECCKELEMFRAIFQIPDNVYSLFNESDFLAGLDNTIYTLNAYNIDGVPQPTVGSTYTVTPGNINTVFCGLNVSPVPAPLIGGPVGTTYTNMSDWLNFVTSEVGITFSTRRVSVNNTEDILGINVVFDKTRSFEIVYSKESIWGTDVTYRMVYDAGIQMVSWGISNDGGISYFNTWNSPVNSKDMYVGLTEA